MGIVNITPDSFYDGDKFLNAESKHQLKKKQHTQMLTQTELEHSLSQVVVLMSSSLHTQAIAQQILKSHLL